MNVKNLSDREIIGELSSNSLLNRVRKMISSSAGEIDQACAQRRMPSPVEIHRMEFTAAEKIIALIKAEKAEESASKHPTSFKLSDTAKDILTYLARKRGIAKSAVIESLIREERDGVT